MLSRPGVKKLCGPIHSHCDNSAAPGRLPSNGAGVKEPLTSVAICRRPASLSSSSPLKSFGSYIVTSRGAKRPVRQRINHPAYGSLYDTLFREYRRTGPGGASRCVPPRQCTSHFRNDRSTRDGSTSIGTRRQDAQKVSYEGWLCRRGLRPGSPELAAATTICDV